VEKKLVPEEEDLKAQESMQPTKTNQQLRKSELFKMKNYYKSTQYEL
jgi:hypothetical protein